MGSQRSVTPKKKIRRRARRKFGMQMPKSAKVVPARSTGPFRRAADRTPTGTHHVLVRLYRGDVARLHVVHHLDLARPEALQLHGVVGDGPVADLVEIGPPACSSSCRFS